MRTTATTVSLLLTAALLAGCGDDNTSSNAGPSSSPSSTSTATTPAPTDSEVPHGPTIERPGYSYNLPENWTDATEQQMLADDLDSYGMRDLGNIHDSDNELTVAVEDRFPKKNFLNIFPSILKSERNTNSAPNIKRVADTEWVGAEAMHAQGPLRGGESYKQIFYFWHDDAGYYISLETTGGRKKNERLLEVIRSSWTWK